ncbi:hypothetical protein NDA13_001801 [Ustilago tritici]|nr:hypothetical protein NDA13_001801 [Ustilago tritici]
MSGRGYDRDYDRDDRDDRRGGRGDRPPRGGRDSRDRAPPTTLFVAGFPPNMRAKDLAYEFERMGPLIRCDIPALKSTSATPYAFVEFEDPRDADAAFRDMHGMRFGRHEISIQFAKNAPSANWRFDGPSRGPPPPPPAFGGRGGRDSRDDRGSSRSDLPPPPPPRPKLTAEEQEEADRAAEERARRRAALRRERSPEPRRDNDADYAEDRRSSSRRDDDADREQRHENGDSATNGKDAEEAAPKDEAMDQAANGNKNAVDAGEENKAEEADGNAGWVSNE